jgi:PHD/YefM family antitoxin component YafN of YafNO toxin-antitoxin module
MPIQLTPDQQRQVKATGNEPAEAVDSAGKRYVLVPAERYEAMVDELDQAALRRSSVKNLARRLEEDA